MSSVSKLNRKELRSLRGGWYEQIVSFPNAETVRGLIRQANMTWSRRLQIKVWSKHVLTGLGGRWDTDTSAPLRGIAAQLQYYEMTHLDDGAIEFQTKRGLGVHATLRLYPPSPKPPWAATPNRA